jgi:hypothetical protein
VRRLVESLRKTEPDAARRASLDELFQQAIGSDLFRETARVATLQPYGLAEAQIRWNALIWGTASWAAAILAAGVWPAHDFSIAMLVAVAAVAPITWVAARNARTGGDSRTYLRGFLLGLVAIGPGLAVPIALLWRGQYDPPGYGDNVLVAWGIVTGLCVALGAIPRGRQRAPSAKTSDAA